MAQQSHRMSTPQETHSIGQNVGVQNNVLWTFCLHGIEGTSKDMNVCVIM